MSQISHAEVFMESLLDDVTAFSGFVGSVVQQLHRDAAVKFGSEIDLSTLRISLRRDSLGLSLKASALELVTVGSRWIRNGAPVSKQGPFKVLTIDHRVDLTHPWLTVEDGWAGRLDYFHRDYTRYPDKTGEVPKPGSYWIMTRPMGIGTKWRCVSAATDVHMVAVHGTGDRWQGTVAEFNNWFKAATD